MSVQSELDELRRKIRELEQKLELEAISEGAAQPITTTINSKGEINVTGSRAVISDQPETQSFPEGGGYGALPKPVKVTFQIQSTAIVTVYAGFFSFGGGETHWQLFHNGFAAKNEDNKTFPHNIGGGNLWNFIGKEANLTVLTAATLEELAKEPYAIGESYVLKLKPVKEEVEEEEIEVTEHTLEIRGGNSVKGLQIKDAFLAAIINE